MRVSDLFLWLLFLPAASGASNVPPEEGTGSPGSVVISRGGGTGGGDPAPPVPPTPGPSKVKLALHAVSYAGAKTCAALPTTAACADDGTSSLNTTWPADTRAAVFVIALDVPPAEGIKGAAFGLDYFAYNYTTYSGIVIQSFTRCQSDLVFASDAPLPVFPQEPQSGVVVTTATCHGSTPDPNDPEGEGMWVLGWLDVTSYGYTGPLEISPRLYLPEPDFQVANCSAAASNPPYPDHAGILGFGGPGYDPCLASQPPCSTPHPEFSTLPAAFILTPDGSWADTVTVACADGPLEGVSVSLTFSASADADIRWAQGQAHPVMSATTDAQGRAVFHLAGGLCPDLAGAVQVTADSVLLGSRRALSPDVVNCYGQPRGGAGFQEVGGLSVDSLDIDYHQLNLGVDSPCSDFDADGVVTAADVAFAASFLGVLGTPEAAWPDCSGPPPGDDDAWDPGDPGSLSSVRFEQLDFFGGLDPLVADTEYGDFGYTLQPGSDPARYLNLLIRNMEGTQTGWAVANMIVPPTTGLSDSVTLYSMFDLGTIGVARGTPVDSLRFKLLLTDTPFTDPPSPVGEYLRAPVEEGLYDAQGGGEEDSTGCGGGRTLPGPTPRKTYESGHPPVYDTHLRSDVPDVQEEVNECGPGSVTRSLLWMRDRGLIQFPDTLEGKTASEQKANLISCLKELSDWNSTKGVPNPKRFLEGKLGINKKLGLDLYNKFMVSPKVTSLSPRDYEHSGSKARYKGRNPTFEFVKQEIDDDEDVEILVGWMENGKRCFGHYMTVVGYGEDTANGLRSLILQDDVQGPDQRKNKLRYVDFVDPEGQAGTPGKLCGLPPNRVEYVVSESPALEPVLSGNEVKWGGMVATWQGRVQPPANIEVPPGETLTFTWRDGRVPKPECRTFTWTNTTGKKVKLRVYSPDRQVSGNEHKSGKLNLKAGNIRQNSPWRHHPLHELPLVAPRIPLIAAAGTDTVYTAINLDAYLNQNPLGPLGGTWAAGDTLGALGLDIVNGQVAGLEGIYWATTPFTFDSLSVTGFVPEGGDSTWLDGASFENDNGPLVIRCESGTTVFGTGIPGGDPEPGAGLRGLAAFPNPTAEGAELRFELLHPAQVEFTVHDLAGRLVRSVGAGPLPSGAHRFTWDGRLEHGAKAPSGIYFLRLRTPEESRAVKLIVTR